MGNYENLKVWHGAIELAVSVCKVTNENTALNKDYSLKDQMRRCAVSISSNISEGDQLGTDKQAVRQFYIAKGSADELYTQITISSKIGYLTVDQNESYLNECRAISAMLTNLIKSRSKE
jgi:four helix bundle protein